MRKAKKDEVMPGLAKCVVRCKMRGGTAVTAAVLLVILALVQGKTMKSF